jgi:hypothetical protein
LIGEREWCVCGCPRFELRDARIWGFSDFRERACGQANSSSRS